MSSEDDLLIACASFVVMKSLENKKKKKIKKEQNDVDGCQHCTETDIYMVVVLIL